MEKEKIVISAGNSYISKYYINPIFSHLPKTIQDKIQIATVSLAQKTKGIATISYTPEGDVSFEVIGENDDIDFDGINAQLELKRTEEDSKELVNGLIAYYKLFIDEQGKDIVKNLKQEDIDSLNF
ncbi:MAG: DUF6145 family protein [Lachnospirales bacterium]